MYSVFKSVVQLIFVLDLLFLYTNNVLLNDDYTYFDILHFTTWKN